MESPYFPIGMQQMPGDLAIEDLRDLTFHVGRVRVDATFVNHPGICVGYRLTTSSGTIAYLPDNEPFQRFRSQIGKPSGRKLAESMKYAQAQDEKLIEFIRDVDVLITDAQYDDAEYQTHAGWGHACVDDVVALAIIARVKRLYLFHHDPDHSDAQISRMVAWARELVALHDESVAVEAAREGLEITLLPRTDPALATAAHS
jgi:phosphoribosyl 1,2-cyclic phosphodiesterase